MTAKADIANYSIATSFGKNRRIRHDAKWTRPATSNEMRGQVEMTYRLNKWGDSERQSNAWMLGLDFKPVVDYTGAELQTILDDMEKFSMILYEE